MILAVKLFALSLREVKYTMPLTLDEVKDLPTEKSQGAKTEELIDFLSDQACSASEIAEFLTVRKAGVYTKLKRLTDEGILKRVYKDGVSYWYAES